MTELSSDILKKIRLNLEEEKKRVLRRIQDLRKQDPFSSTDRLADNASVDTEATEETSHDRSAAMVEALTDQLANINAALSRIGRGSYGICQNCDRPIGASRLAVNPTATLCLECEKQKKYRAK